MQNADANKVKLVNIDEIVKSKSPKLYKFIPKFLLSYLKKITHQDGVINYMIANHSDKEPHVFSTICLNHFGAVRKVEGIENFRITSYNVCYTKLLRIFIHFWI